MGKIYRASAWDTMLVFDRPTDEVLIEKQTHAPLPRVVGDAINTFWGSYLDYMISQLGLSGLEKKRLGQEKAVYLGRQPLVWNGPTLRLDGHRVDENEDGRAVKLHVSNVNYAMFAGRDDPGVKGAFSQSGIAVPDPPLGFSALTVTTDGKLILTSRQHTTNYHGRFHGQGGNPYFPSDGSALDPVGFVHAEIEGETFYPAKEKKPPVKFLALARDLRDNKGKPELVGFCKTADESRYVLELFEKGKRTWFRQPHVGGLEVVDGSRAGLMDYLTKQNPDSFCPPAHANLVLYADSVYPEFSKELKGCVGWLHAVPE